MKYTFIVNPKSRSGRGKMIWKLIEPELKKQRISYEVFYTEYAEHAVRLTENLTSDGQEHTLVIVGGDGTVNEVVNGISDYSKVTLGYIPTGSGNDFTRALRLPADPLAALDNILQTGRKTVMDIGWVRWGEEIRRFAVSTGIGFDAAVCHEAAVSEVKRFLNKLGLGKLTYLVIAVKNILTEQPVWAEVTLDGTERKWFSHVYFTAVMNHPYEGGGFFFCPKAQIGDGRLDVIVVSDLPKWKIFLLLPTAFWGKHVKYKGISIYQCREITVKMGRKLPVHADGEPVATEKSISAGVETGQLHVLAPVNYDIHKL